MTENTAQLTSKKARYGQNTFTQGLDATIILAVVAHWQMANGSDLDPGKVIGPDLDVLKQFDAEDGPEDLRAATRLEKSGTASAFADWWTVICPACNQSIAG